MVPGSCPLTRPACQQHEQQPDHPRSECFRPGCQLLRPISRSAGLYYIDDVPLFVNFNLTDIERVRCCAGPQVRCMVRRRRRYRQTDPPKPDLGVFSAEVTAILRH